MDITRQILPMTRIELAPDAHRDIEDTATVAERVVAARDRQAFRYLGQDWRLNSEVPGPVMRRELRLDSPAYEVLEQAYASNQLTARGVDRTMRVAWTLADLAGLDRPDRDLVQDACQLRSGTGIGPVRDLRSGTGDDRIAG
jgi:magnesium chelatase family protein